MLSLSEGLPVLRPGRSLPPTGAELRLGEEVTGPYQARASSETAPKFCACGGQRAKRTAHHRDHDSGLCAGTTQFAVRGVSPPPTPLTRREKPRRSDQTGPLYLEPTDETTHAATPRREMISSLQKTSLGGGLPTRGCAPEPVPAQAPLGAPSLRYGRAGAPRHPARGRSLVNAAATPSNIEHRWEGTKPPCSRSHSARATRVVSASGASAARAAELSATTSTWSKSWMRSAKTARPPQSLRRRAAGSSSSSPTARRPQAPTTQRHPPRHSDRRTRCADLIRAGRDIPDRQHALRTSQRASWHRSSRNVFPSSDRLWKMPENEERRPCRAAVSRACCSKLQSQSRAGTWPVTPRDREEP